jgi:hypothetical protein
MSKSRSVGILGALLLVGATSGALSATNVATSPSSQQAVIAAVKRLAPEGCEAREFRFLSAEAVEIVGQCDPPSRLARYMQSVERAGGNADCSALRRELREAMISRYES